MVAEPTKSRVDPVAQDLIAQLLCPSQKKRIDAATVTTAYVLPHHQLSSVCQALQHPCLIVMYAESSSRLLQQQVGEMNLTRQSFTGARWSVAEHVCATGAVSQRGKFQKKTQKVSCE